MMPPEYTIVIPLFNHSHFIEQALNSCLEQTHPPKRIIVIDDGSTDESFEIAKKIAQKNSMIEVYKRVNKGAHATINEAISKVKTEYVTILNSDDIYPKNRFSVLLNYLAHSPQTDLVFSRVLFIDEKSNNLGDIKWYEDRLNFFKKTNDLALSLINGNFSMTTSNFLFKTSLFTEVEGFSAYRYAHDLDFLLKTLLLKKRIDFLDQSLLLYRIHQKNTIKESREKIFKEVSIIQKDYLQKAKPGSLFILKNFVIAIHNRYFFTFLKTMLSDLKILTK
jgi:glycosyltransferase involved in cell wall biosynthesis